MTRPLSLFLLASLGLMACEPPSVSEEQKAWDKMRYDQELKSRENCLAQGGIIVVSEWSGRIKDCVWPSTKGSKP